VNVGTWLTGLPFVRSIDDARQFAKPDHHSGNPAFVMNTLDPVSRKLIEFLIQRSPLTEFFKGAAGQLAGRVISLNQGSRS
jgi:hypothetical protein